MWRSELKQTQMKLYLPPWRVFLEGNSAPCSTLSRLLAETCPFWKTFPANSTRSTRQGRMVARGQPTYSSCALSEAATAQWIFMTRSKKVRSIVDASRYCSRRFRKSGPRSGGVLELRRQNSPAVSCSPLRFTTQIWPRIFSYALDSRQGKTQIL